MDSMMIIFDINEFFYSDSQGKIVLSNVKPGYHSLTCEINNTVIIIDSIFPDLTMNRIRLYDYMFEPDKRLIDWAKDDIQSKNMKILLAGLPLLYKSKSESEKRKEDFEKKYGIYFEYHSCDPGVQWLYNYKIFNYLDGLYGDDWRKDYDFIWKRN